jgi:hypothetical protein
MLFSAMKHLFSSFFILFLCFSTLNAQTTELDTDRPSNFTDPASISIPTFVPQPAFEHTAVIRYNNLAKCFVTFAANDAIIKLVSCKSVESGKVYEAILQNNTALFKNLPLNQKYELLAVNGQDKLVLFDGFNTYPRIKEPIKMTAGFYNKLAKWTVTPKDIPLSQFLTDLKEISYYERLAFFQQYLLEDQPLEDTLGDDHFPNANTNAKMSPSGCKCEFAITTIGSVNGGLDAEGNANSTYGVVVQHQSPQEMPIC